MSDHPDLPRTVRGKRPQFFQNEGVDEVLSMVLAVAQELAVLRERVDTAERVMEKHGVNLAAEIEALEPDEDLLKSREQWLQDFYRRIFFILDQKRAEFDAKASDDSFMETIDKVAKGDL